MDERKPRVALPIIVEGRYDKATLSSIVDAAIFPTGGFSVFNSREKQALFRRLAENGVILLTDSDGGGRQIRSFLSGILPKDKLHHLWIPEIPGKERRKRAPGKAGLLGVEGMDRDTLLAVLAPFIVPADAPENAPAPPKEPITKLDLYRDGLSGGEGAAAKRAALARHFGLPSDMSANSLLAALNLITDADAYHAAVAEITDSPRG